MAFIVRPTSKGFRVLEETYNPIKVKTVPKIAWERLGFNPAMSVDEAKARAKQLNQQANIENKAVSNTARRVELMKTEASAYLPMADMWRFEAEIDEMYFDNPYRLEITKRYWKAAQIVILELKIDSQDFASGANVKLLNYFKRKKWSLDYIKRIVRILDLWGKSVARHRGSHYEPIPRFNSVQVQKINDIHLEQQGSRMPAEPLNWITLKNAKDKFDSEGLTAHWNWMFIATWFGLRPLEVDNLRKLGKFWRVNLDKVNGVQVLWIYQTKLIGIPHEKRWKPIPIYSKEQKLALDLIQSQDFTRPLNKTLRRLLGQGIETYSPRKGFVDLMLGLGFQLEDIATFLGHHSIETTWRHYKDRQKFKMPKIS